MYMFIRYYVLFVVRPFVLSLVSPAYRAERRAWAEYAETASEAEHAHFQPQLRICECCFAMEEHVELGTYYEADLDGMPREVILCQECAEHEGQ